MSAETRRLRRNRNAQAPSHDGSDGGGGLRDARTAAERLFHEGDDIIERALSGDSEESESSSVRDDFDSEDGRQEGGQ